MNTLIAQASESLAKAGMNRRGFLGRLVRATTGAAVLTAGLATAVRADHCSGSHRCRTDYFERVGQCGHRNCSSSTAEAVWKKYKVVHCYTRQFCGWEYVWSHCESNACPK